MFKIFIFAWVLSCFSLKATPDVSQYLPTFTQLSDESYVYRTTENFKYIYPKAYQSWVEQAIKQSALVANIYEQSFKWKQDERANLIWASSRNQEANAFATMFPHTINMYYGGGAFLADYFAFKSWSLGLITHEMAHLYQMNPKRDVGMVTKKIWGNHPFFLWPIVPIPVFPFPNFALPTWVLEGNAVFNESTFGNGGRLYSGAARALFYSLLKSHVLDETRLTNNHMEFPYAEEKYLIGGFFNLYLAEKYGVEKLNQFFYAHANHYFNPLRINSTFTRHFGRSYSNEISDFLYHYQMEANKMHQDPTDALVTSKAFNYLNRVGDKILFITSKDLKSKATLNFFDVKTKLLSSRPTELYTGEGKVFFIDGAYYLSRNGLNHQKQVYGLWDEEGNLLEGTENKVYLGSFQKRMLAFDVPRSFQEPYLVYGDKELGFVHSIPYLSEKTGEIYTFKQREKKRTLFKGEEAITSIGGYYGRVVDVDEDHRVIYFIAATNRGTGLFSYDELGQKFERINHSDAVVDAKKTGKNQFFIVEITSEGYVYKNVETAPFSEGPFEYVYAFENQARMHLFDHEETVKVTDLSSESSYIAPLELRFEKMNMLFSQNFFRWDFDFSDPMMKNTLNAYYSFDGRNAVFDKQNAHVTYSNSLFSFKWFIDYNYAMYTNNPSLSSAQTASLGLVLPWWVVDRSSLSSDVIVGHYDELNNVRDSNVQEYANLNFKHTKNYARSYLPSLQTAWKGEFRHKELGNDFNFATYNVVELGGEFFMENDAHYTLNKSGEMRIGEDLRGVQTYFPTGSYFFTGDTNYKGGKLGLGLRKVFNVSAYFPVFPVSLNRFSLRGFEQLVSYQGDHLPKKNIYETGVGLEFDLLLVHLVSTKVSYDYLIRSTGDSEFFLRFGVFQYF